MRKIAMLNQKGGVGKTTSVVNIAAALAQSGAKVAVADFDPQAHLTIHLGVEPDSVQSGAYEVLTSGADFDHSLIEVRPNLFLLGANIHLVGAESELVSVVGREIIFREAIAKSQHNFDFLIIDCPPSLGLLTLNALAAVDEVIIPLQPHFLALQGLGKLLQTVQLVSQRINPQLKVSGVLLCMFDSRISLSEEVKNDIDKFLQAAKTTDLPWNSAQVIPVYVRRNIKLAEAPSYGKTVFEYEPECNGSKDYQQIADFLRNGSAINPSRDSNGAVNLAPGPVPGVIDKSNSNHPAPVVQSRDSNGAVSLAPAPVAGDRIRDHREADSLNPAPVPGLSEPLPESPSSEPRQ